MSCHKMSNVSFYHRHHHHHPHHFSREPYISLFSFFLSSISSTSSSSSSDAPSKYPTLPHPDYSPLEGPGKPSKQYRRRTDGKDVDHKPIKIQVPPKDSKVVNGNITHEHHVKTSKDTRDAIEVREERFCLTATTK